ncbi:hypothetical protein DVR12_22915 [Chitinophaga silvatica]|uniref:Secretion system C-terminal sorting domain-containing protein n=1 Tax=Chitinophaga silvatica TaxID=2282649 RepID=A0A3E1Y486_9BACT|nr:hypothetical protein [Chitinophaga silvatica]RFS19489.1 hypothetical protein DVR12_22915 [Chitinophaga silvatica]
MKIFIPAIKFTVPLSNQLRRWLISFAIFLTPAFANAQTSWKGTTSSSWSVSANWTAGVPTAATDVTIGDANFTGPYSPSVDVRSRCRSLTISSGTLTVNRSLTVYGTLTISSGATLSHGKANLNLKGSFTNSGTYTATNTNAIVTFSGTTQSISGNTTSFNGLTIGAGSTTTINVNTSVVTALTVNGTLLPAENATPIVVSGAANTIVNPGGELNVKASTYSGNYNLSGTLTLAANSAVNYSATLVNQTISNTPTYSTLRISGTGTKTLGGNLNPLNATAANTGNIEVLAATLDLATFSANRGTTIAGGYLRVVNGALLRIGGTNTFPTNYATTVLPINSTVEYYGNAQTVTALQYGNLTLSSTSGAVVKTLPASTLTITGNLTLNQGTGSSVSTTLAATTNVYGNTIINSNTTLNGGSSNLNITGNLSNAGTLTGASGTITMLGDGATISGTGTNSFNNLVIQGDGITAAATTNITVAGNLSSVLPGTFTHSSGGVLTMSGSAKSISGTGFTFSNLTISGSVSSASNLTITDNLVVSGSLSSTGAVNMTGTTKTISGSGTIGFSTLSISGAVTTAVSYSVSTALNVYGTFSATAGTTTFTGTSVLNGTASLFNVTINGTSLQLATSANLGIAGTYTLTAGTLNTTTTTPNTVTFNSTGAQTIAANTFYNLIVAGGNTKTIGGAVTVNGDFTIASGTTVSAGSQTLTVQGNWNNNGTFTPGSSTVVFSGAGNSTITGTTTFNILTISKSADYIQVIMLSNVGVATVNMTTGTILTTVNTLTISNTRNGNGIILGNITRTNTFLLGSTYAFESPNTTISVTGLFLGSSITISTLPGAVSDFPSGSSINREYDVSASGLAVGLSVTLRFHYETNVLNGNAQNSLDVWRNTGSGWSDIGSSSSNSGQNYVEVSGLLTTGTGRYTLGAPLSVVRWNGSVSSDWNTAGNWTTTQGSPARPPGTSDVAEIGTAAFTNQPTINNTVNIKGVYFGSTQAATLTLGTSGSLTTAGNIAGSWSANATHTINVNNQNLTVNGILALSDGTSGHAIQLNVGSGSVTVAGDLVQSGSASIVFSGAGQLNLGGNYNYSAGTFTAGSSTVTYNGSGAQIVGGVNYNNLTVNSTSNNTGLALLNNTTIVNGNISVIGGTLNINGATTVAGNVTINNAATVNAGNIFLSVGGNWSSSGVSFAPGLSTLNFNGSSAQSINATTFNNVTINNTGSTVTLAGNLTINGNLSLSAGTLDVSNYTINRSLAGGTCSAASGTTLSIGGASNFPSNFTIYTLNSGSTTNYYSTTAQTINSLSYGTLQLNGSNKTLAGNIVVNGDLQINSTASLSPGTSTIDLYGNWTNNGTFTPGTGTVTLRGSSKTLTGNTTFNRLSVFGSYVVSGSNISYNSTLQVLASASYDNGSGATSVAGDLYNNGSYTASGTITFAGTNFQTLRLSNAITYNAAGTINFNGTVTPSILLGATPSWPAVNIANTAGINPGDAWNVQGAFSVAARATFNGGQLPHQFSNAVNNSGTIQSAGTLSFTPSSSQTVQLTGINSTGTLLFAGSAALNLSGTPTLATNIIIANSNAVAPAASYTINGNLQIYAGSVFSAGSNNYVVNGNLESNGTFNGGTSTVTMGSANGYLAGGDSTVFYNIVFNGTIAAVADFCVANNLTNNGSINTSIGIAVMTGSSNGNINGTASPFALAQLEVSKSAGISALLARTPVLSTNLDILSGVLDTQDSTITQDPTNGGTLVIKNNARLIIRGIQTLPTYNIYKLDTLSTVEYAGTIQTVAAVTPYGNLVISAAGNKTAPAALHILNNFTLSNGNFIQGAFVDTLEGSWTMTSGTYTYTGSTVLFSGLADQQVSSTGNFNNINVKKNSGQVVLNANTTVDGILTFTKSNIRTGSNIAIISASGSVTGAAQATGWVYGFLRKYISAGSNVTYNFEVGDSLNYTPLTTLFTSVGTAGNVTANTVTGVHPALATSGLNTSRKVNRYWTLTNNSLVYTTAAVTMNWVAADVDAGATTANFKVAEYNGTSWTLPTTVSPQPLSIQATGLTSFGDLAVGELAASFIWTGAVSTNWFVNGNWSTNSIPLISSNVIIPTGLTNYPLITTGTSLASNLTIQTGASVVVNGGSLQINGLITNTGTLDATNGTMIFSGAAPQTIAAATFLNNSILNLNVTNSTTVTIGGTLNISGILKVNTGTLATGNFLTLLSTASQTALIDGSGTGQVTGNVTVQRYVPSSFGYRYLSSPFQSATVSQFGTAVNLSASFPSFYSYNETLASAGWVNYTTTTNPLVPLQGYAAQLGANSTPITISITGVVNNQTITAPTLTNTNQPYTQGFNLIGNPYPSPIDWNATSGWSLTNIDNAIYYFNPGATDQYGGTYSSYIAGVSSDGIATNIIPAMQGFFIHVSNGTFPVTGSLSVNNAARINNLTPNFHREPQNIPLLRINTAYADDGLAPDPLVIYFDAAAKPDFEQGLDALKITNTDNSVPTYYSWSADHQRLSVGAWPEFPDSNTVIPLGLQLERKGFVTFNTVTLQRMPADLHIYLKDAVTNQYTTLQENEKYRVYMEPGKYDQRFSLVFKKTDTDNAPAESDFRAYSVGRNLYGFIEKLPNKKCTITVSNLLGQVLWQRDYVESGAQLLGSQYASGLYVVVFYVDGKKITRKVFISN